MLRQLFKFYPRRNFSNSAVWKDSKKEVASTPKQEAQTTTATTTTTTTTTPPNETFPDSVVRIDFVPNKLEKFILVYSGRYKSKDEIPPRIGYSTIGTAWSKVRIKLANYLMLSTMLVFCFYIWKGKRDAKAGDTIVARGIAYKNKLQEEAGVKRD